MIDECPHCFARMIAGPTGECPACHRDIHDTLGTDPAKTGLSVLHGAQLPPFCCDCGAATDRYVKVKSTIGGPGGDNTRGTLLSILLTPFSLVAGLIAYAASASERTSRRPNDEAVVRMPQCAPCGSTREPKPIRIDTEQLRLTFVVHREFAKKVAPAER